MGYLINIKNTKNRSFNEGVAYVGDKQVRFDGSDSDKATILSIARACSKTLLGRTVPINYSREKDESYTDGKTIVISSHIKEDSLDSTIGLVLHESSHIAITDFDTWNSTPKKLDDRNIDKKFAPIAFNLLNWIEDRRIDNWAYNRAPGYVKYYEALYHRYFLPAERDAVIQEFKKRPIEPSLENYLFLIFNMLNDEVKMDELPKLDEINKLIDLDNVERFNNTVECQDVALDVLKIILENLPEGNGEGDGNGGSSNGSGRGKLKPKLDENGEETGEFDASDLTDEELKDLIKEIIDNHSKLSNNLPSGSESMVKMDENTAKRIEDIIQNSEIGDLLKQNSIANNSPKSNSETFQVKCKQAYEINSTEVTVIDKINKAYITLGNGTFVATPDRYALRGYSKGREKGKLLAKKLKLREEIRETRIIRQKRGKIDNRTIYTGGFTQDEMFYKSIISKYDNTNVHISVDASGSMSGTTWEETIMLLTTLAFGFLDIKNLRLQISFRTTLTGNEVYLFYDSAIDKSDKLYLLPHVHPVGGTPEGICFKGMNNRVMLPLMNKNTLFINLSDGAPGGNLAKEMTKESIKLYESLGMQILSFLIEDSNSFYYNLNGGSSSWNTFVYMYGAKNSRKISSEDINKIAFELNKKLLNFNK